MGRVPGWERLAQTESWGTCQAGVVLGLGWHSVWQPRLNQTSALIRSFCGQTVAANWTALNAHDLLLLWDAMASLPPSHAGWFVGSAGWQKLAGFRRTQKMSSILSSGAYSLIRGKSVVFGHNCKYMGSRLAFQAFKNALIATNLNIATKLRMLGLKIFVLVQNFWRSPFALPRNFYHPVVVITIHCSL